MSSFTKFTVSQLSSSAGGLILKGGQAIGQYADSLILSGAVRLEKLSAAYNEADGPALYVGSTGKLEFKADEGITTKKISDAGIFGTLPSAGMQLLTSNGTTGAIQGNAGLSFQIADNDALFTLTTDSRFEFSKDNGSNVLLNMGDIGGNDEIQIGKASTIPVKVLGDLSVGDDLTIAGDTDIAGNLTVRGTTTIINTTNLSVKDQMVVIGSGSSGPGNPGAIIISSGSSEVVNNDLYVGRVGQDLWGVGKAATKGGAAATSILAAGVPVGFRADSIQFKTGASGALLVLSGAAGTTGDRINLATAGTVPGAGHTLTLGGNLTVTANSEDVTLHAQDNASTITLDNATLEIENTNATSRAMKVVVGTDADATLTVEGTSGVINQDVSSDATPDFVSIKGTGLTASKLVGTNASKVLASIDLDDFVAGTTNQITVTDDTDGSITLSTPQNLDSGADVVFGTLKQADAAKETMAGGTAGIQVTGSVDFSGNTTGHNIKIPSNSGMPAFQQRAFGIYAITGSGAQRFEKFAMAVDDRNLIGAGKQHRHAALSLMSSSMGGAGMAAKRGIEIHTSGSTMEMPSLVSILANTHDRSIPTSTGFNPQSAADTSFFVSGSTFNRKVGVDDSYFSNHPFAGTSVFGGDLVMSGAAHFTKKSNWNTAGLTAGAVGVESNDSAFFYAKADHAGNTAIWVHSSSGGTRVDFPLLSSVGHGGGGGGGGTMSSWTLSGDSGSSQAITDGNTVDIAGGDGVATVASATDTVTVTVDLADTTPGLDFSSNKLRVKPAQVGITSVANTALTVGRDDDNLITFATDNQIGFEVGTVQNAMVLELLNSAPALSLGITGGTSAMTLVANLGLGDDTSAELPYSHQQVLHANAMDLDAISSVSTGYTIDFSKYSGAKIDVVIESGNDRLCSSLLVTAKENVSNAVDIVMSEQRAATTDDFDFLTFAWVQVSGQNFRLEMGVTGNAKFNAACPVTVSGVNLAGDLT